MTKTKTSPPRDSLNPRELAEGRLILVLIEFQRDLRRALAPLREWRRALFARRVAPKPHQSAQDHAAICRAELSPRPPRLRGEIWITRPPATLLAFHAESLRPVEAEPEKPHPFPVRLYRRVRISGADSKGVTEAMYEEVLPHA